MRASSWPPRILTAVQWSELTWRRCTRLTSGKPRASAITQRSLPNNLVNVVGEALQSLAPARLSWGIGTATFAVNRRNNREADVAQRRQDNSLVGPVDHDVPVLAIHDDASNLRAIVCGYACHATVLDDYFVSADWPGVAQRELEQRHPGTTVLYWAGCGGDQNPLPRRSIDWMNQHGRALADAVDATLRKPLEPIAGTLRTAYEEVEYSVCHAADAQRTRITRGGRPAKSRLGQVPVGQSWTEMAGCQPVTRIRCNRGNWAPN